MELAELHTDVQVKLIEFAWEAVKLCPRPQGSTDYFVGQISGAFTQALDGFVRGYESAGKAKKTQ